MPIILAPVAKFNTQKRSTQPRTQVAVSSPDSINNIDDAQCALRKQKTAAAAGSLASDNPVRPDAKIVRRRGGQPATQTDIKEIKNS